MLKKKKQIENHGNKQKQEIQDISYDKCKRAKQSIGCL